MDKKLTKTDLRVRILMLVIACGILAALTLTGCNPVKKVLKDESKMREVWEEGVLKDWCKSDSVIKFLPGRVDSIPYPVPITRKELDTAALRSAIKRVIDSSDQECLTAMELSYSAGYNDAIDKIGKQKFADKKPDTVQVTKFDTDKEKLLEKKNSELQGQLVEKEKQLKQAQDKEKEQRKRANKWRLYFWLFLAVVVAIITRRYWLGAAGKLLGWAGKAIQLITKK